MLKYLKTDKTNKFQIILKYVQYLKIIFFLLIDR